MRSNYEYTNTTTYMALIGFSNKTNTYKVVQLHIDGQPVHGFGEKTQFHTEIVRQTLNIYNIQYPFLLPTYQGKRFTLLGCGHIDIDAQNKWFTRLYGQSIGYNRGPNKELETRLQKELIANQYQLLLPDQKYQKLMGEKNTF